MLEPQTLHQSQALRNLGKRIGPQQRIFCPEVTVNAPFPHLIVEPNFYYLHYAYLNRTSFLNYFRKLGKIMKKENKQRKYLVVIVHYS